MSYWNNWCGGTMARDATTGELIWAYGDTPAEPWDLDIPLIHPLIQYQGEDAVVLASRNGWFYVWDRDDGTILNQPWMHTFVDVMLSVNLDTGLPEYTAETWAFTHLEDRRRYTDYDPMAGIRDPAEYTGTEVEFCPGTSARNWFNDVYNPVTGYLYTVNNTSCSTWEFFEGEYVVGEGYNLERGAGPAERRWFYDAAPVAQTHYTWEALRDAPETDITNQLMANDPETGTQAWTVDFTQGNETPIFGTAGGLLFQGDKGIGALVAYDAATGEKLWQFNTGSGFEGSAISYMGVDGRQYIAVIGSQQNTSTVNFDDNPADDGRFRRGGSSLYVFALPTSVAGN
jgi:glucose dehydrogenase